MDGSRFDQLARTLAEPGSRRRFLGGLVGGAAGAFGLSRAEAATCRSVGNTCSEHAQCCSKDCGPKDRTGRRRCRCKTDAHCPVSRDQCNDIACNTAAGQCEPQPKQNGTSCNDGNVCTQTDTCQNGACVGGNPVVCTVDHGSASCTPATGTCKLDRCDEGYESCDGSTCVDVPEGRCWYLGSVYIVLNAPYCECKMLDGCHGGGDSSHGGCYKWTVGQNDPFTAWPV